MRAGTAVVVVPLICTLAGCSSSEAVTTLQSDDAVQHEPGRRLADAKIAVQLDAGDALQAGQAEVDGNHPHPKDRQPVPHRVHALEDRAYRRSCSSAHPFTRRAAFTSRTSQDHPPIALGRSTLSWKTG